jgi:glycerol-3-phosphate O-acyltransferase
MSDFISKLNAFLEKGLINAKLKTLIQEFYGSYRQALAQSSHSQKDDKLFQQLIDLVIEKIQHPYTFSIFHQSIRQPFDYYQFGLDFIRPFVDFQHSKIFGIDNIKSIQAQLKKGENVILLANHQTEPDPQIISLLLEKIDPKLASDMVFVAGHRVISDPIAIPMSLGRNLLCIYSKKHISHPPEEKAQKILHNQKTLKKMQELLNEGGYCIYVAPSGGRDRPNAAGEFDVAPFDPQSIELFWLMGQQAERPTHFYPLALQTYHLMPPPRQVEKELGERRIIHISPVYLAFGEEIDMENFPGNEHLDKKAKREKRAEYIWNQVRQDYQSFPKSSPSACCSSV